MKTIITLLIGLFALNVSGQIQLDSTYFFNPDSTKNWWYVQNDVFSFRLNNGNEYTDSYNTSIINSITYFPYSTSKQNAVRFNPQSTMSQRVNKMASIKAESSVKYVTIAITQIKASQNDYSQEDYKRLNNHIIVNFDDPDVTESEVDDFMDRNNLELIHEPSPTLPSANWSYIFKVISGYANTFEACQSIFVSEYGFITRCIPNIIDLFQPGDLGINDNFVLDGSDSSSTNEGFSPAKLAYYNPNEIGVLFEKGSNKNGCGIEVYNSFGKKIMTERISKNVENQSINITSFAQGIYFLHIVENDNGFEQTIKFMK